MLDMQTWTYRELLEANRHYQTELKAAPAVGKKGRW